MGWIMHKKQDKCKNKLIIIVISIAVCVLLAFLLFPRKYEFKDGGSVMYCSVAFGAIYKVEQRHRIYVENGYSYFEIGTVVTVFGVELYNNAHVDYDHPQSLAHSEEVQKSVEEWDKYFETLYGEWE